MLSPILTFVHIADTHIPLASNTTIAVGNPYDGAKALVKQINALPFHPDFILHTGDAIYNRDPQEYAACQEILGDIQYPVYYVAGNSDDIATLQNTLMQREVAKPILYDEFEVKGVQIVILDSNHSTVEPPAGYVSEQQLIWLNALCTAEDNRPLIIAMHHNPQVGGIPWLDDITGIQNTEALYEAILPARQRIRGVFFGHIHQNLDVYRDGILYSSTLSSWAQFHAWPGQTSITPDPHDGPGFSVVMIYAGQTVIRRHRFAT